MAPQEAHHPDATLRLSANRGVGDMSGTSPAEVALYVTLIVALYKIVCLAVGLAFAYMGYRLFLAGIDRPAGNLQAEAEAGKLSLTGAAPGVFFALFGTAVIGFTIIRGLNIDLPGPVAKVADILPADPPDVESANP